MKGRFVSVEPLDTHRHLDDLHQAFAEDPDGRLWTYMPVGPFASRTELQGWMEAACAADDPLFHALIDNATGRAVGMAAYLRIKPAIGVIEIGSITFSPALQRQPAATEAMFLFMARAFDELGYRRYEWKCDALNAASRRAAERLGFRYEGLFEQALVYKGRNRDTAWYAILDRNWPTLKGAFREWLAEDNFDAAGRQKQALGRLIEDARR